VEAFWAVEAVNGAVVHLEVTVVEVVAWAEAMHLIHPPEKTNVLVVFQNQLLIWVDSQDKKISKTK
jgi:hypothetical protein